MKYLYPALCGVAALTAVALPLAGSAAARRSPAPSLNASCGCAMEDDTPAARTPPASGSSRVVLVEGKRAPGEASVSTAAMKYLPFDVPEGVTRITIHKEFDHGSGMGANAAEKNTVDFGLFDPRGNQWGGPGFRGWQGGAPGDFIVSGETATSSPHAVAGPIPAGRWHIAQYFLKSTPTGLGYRYTITFESAGAKPPRRNVPVPSYEPGILSPRAGWYAGNLHSHTIHSDGGRTLADMIARNRAAGFDFVASTEHNSTAAHHRFPEAAAANPGMLLLYGDELTTPGGHANIVGQRPGHWFDFRMDFGDGKLPGIIAEAHRQGALFMVNHPFAACTSCTWKYPEREWAAADAIEVWNGNWTPEDRLAVDLWDSLLKKGRRVWAFGGTDYHRGEDALTPAALVYAENLSREAVMTGLRRGRVMLSEGPKGPRLSLTPEGEAKTESLPGDTVKVGADRVRLTLRVTGAAPGMRVRLVWATGEETLSPLGAGNAELTAGAPAPEAGRPGYVRAELLHPDGSRVAALTNPLFLER